MQHWLNGLRSDITFQKPDHLGSYSVNRCLFTVYKHTWLSPPWHLLGSPLNLPSRSWAWPLWSKSWWGGDPGARPPSMSEGSRPGRSPTATLEETDPKCWPQWCRWFAAHTWYRKEESVWTELCDNNGKIFWIGLQTRRVATEDAQPRKWEESRRWKGMCHNRWHSQWGPSWSFQ